MYNLIQIQDAIRGLPIQDVMKYARGTNPDVPAYLALAELNRRKQIQETSSAFYGEPQTVREQIESSLTGAPANQVNPTIGSQTANPTATPPQLQTLTAPPPKPQMPAMPMVPPQVNPTQAPPVPQMRKGGLASLPVKMFKRANYSAGGIMPAAKIDGNEFVLAAQKYGLGDDITTLNKIVSLVNNGMSVDKAASVVAGKNMAQGGIVAFSNGGATERSAFQQDLIDLFGYSKEKETSPYERDIKPKLERLKSYFTEPRAEAVAPATTTAQAEAQDMEGSSAKEPTKPNQQASATTSGQIVEKREPAKPLFGQRAIVTQPQIPELSDEQLLERRRKLQELAGVSADPYADIKKRYADIEARRKADEEGDTMRSITAGLRGFAQAKATDPFGVQLAAAGDKMAALDKEQTALRDKQATAMAELQLGIAKEEDARRRGDVTAVESARAAQEKAKMDLAKLEIDRMNAESNRIQATRPAAEIQMIERVMKDKKMTFPEAMEYMQGIKGMNALRTAADKEWNESLSLRMEWEKKGGYPAYMASKGLAVGGGSAAPTGGAPKEGDKATSKSGKPIIFRNGQWEYQ